MADARLRLTAISATALVVVVGVVGVAASQAQPLSLELTSSRDVCTVGTLTEIQWSVSGG